MGWNNVGLEKWSPNSLAQALIQAGNFFFCFMTHEALYMTHVPQSHSTAHDDMIDFRIEQKSHSSIDNLAQSNDFNQKWTSLRFKSIHPSYWFFFFETPTIELLKEEKKRINYKLHFLTLFKIQLCLLTLLWFNLVLLVSILFNSVPLLASARNVLLMTLKLCSFISFLVIFFTLNHWFFFSNLNIRSIG